MSYLALARKWRPRDFSSLIGQQHVLQALINSIDKQNLHHAYLFTGTRGVGKTTVGRIIAKALNCQKGISSTPCNTCQNCIDITEGNFPDLLEIDAASRTKVEDTREMLENIVYAPTSGRFKIYLIDEVHMLSTHSFNALLKTLEEPPEYVKFILATTELHKIPETILSRCLKFNLRNLDSGEILEYLKSILKQENYDYDSLALELIANAANGSMRDALSITDQAIAFCNDNFIKHDDIINMLGVIGRSDIINILTILSKKDTAELLKILNNLREKYIDYDFLLKNLQQELHNIFLYQKTEFLVHGDLLDLAKNISPELIEKFYQLCTNARRELPYAPSTHMAFEMVMLQMLDLDCHVAVAPRNDEEKSSRAQESRHCHATDVSREGGDAQPGEANPVKARSEKIDLSKWQRFIERLQLSVLDKQILENSNFSFNDGILNISLKPNLQALLTKESEVRICSAISKTSANKVKSVNILIADNFDAECSVAVYAKRSKEQRQEELLNQANQDPNVKNILENFDGRLNEVSE